MLYILVHTVTNGFEGMEELSTVTVQYIHSCDNWKEKQIEIALARNHQNFSVKNNEWVPHQIK
jgi:hypothetical protein